MTKKMNTLREIASIIESHDQFVITGHINPDGDCMGSMLALGTGIKKMGKKARIIVEAPLTGSLRALEQEWDFIYADDFAFEEADQIVIAVDSGDEGRLPELPEHNLTVINIDHHQSNSMYGKYNYVDVKAAAAAEIIYQLIEEMQVELDQKIAYYINIALITDTGCFRYSNTNPRILRLTADFIEKFDIDTNRIFKTFLGTKPLTAMRFKGQVYSKMELHHGGKVAMIKVNEEMVQEVGATMEDASHISGDLRDIEGVEVGVSVVEVEPGVIQLGFRSNFYVPVNEVAISFGGGGHLRASGATLEGDLDEVAEQVLAKIAEYLE